MQFWDSINGTTTWKDHIAAVKAKYPKPSQVLAVLPLYVPAATL